MRAVAPGDCGPGLCIYWTDPQTQALMSEQSSVCRGAALACVHLPEAPAPGHSQLCSASPQGCGRAGGLPGGEAVTPPGQPGLGQVGAGGLSPQLNSKGTDMDGERNTVGRGGELRIKSCDGNVTEKGGI